MILCRSPYRISFFGGGTDYEEWFKVHGGEFLSTAINRYCYSMINVRENSKKKKNTEYYGNRLKKFLKLKTSDNL